jgi:hypothetical protein
MKEGVGSGLQNQFTFEKVFSAKKNKKVVRAGHMARKFRAIWPTFLGLRYR